VPLLQAQTGNGDFNLLKIPPLLTGEQRSGLRHFDLTARAGQTEFFSGIDTPTMGINGTYLGPTLRLRNGDEVALNVLNRLSGPTTLHWHGLHVPAVADGGPHQVVRSGQDWRAQFTVQQPAGTFWYHSHLNGSTGEQVYRGLAGMILLEDETTANSGLPNEYGVDDIPLIVQDRRFNRDGSLSYVRNHMDVMMGVTGDTVLVNGTYNPLFTPRTTKVRFRLLNAANARTFSFAFDDSRVFDLISVDGGRLEQPEPLQQIVLAPSERADIVVDFSNGSRSNLISQPLPADSPWLPRGMMRNMFSMNNQSMQILAIEPQSALQNSAALPAMLGTVPHVDAGSADRTRQFTLTMMMGMGMGRGGGRGGQGMAGGNFFINNTRMDMDVINHRIPVGSTEVWRITNDSMMMHPFHVHHNQFSIISRNNRPAPLWERALKDTVKIAPGETVEIAMRFENFADPENPYMYHCHILEHEDNGMMGQFVVE